MAKTYEVIQTQTLSTPETSVIFSNIPQTYTDLVFTYHTGLTSGVQNDWLQINGNTTSLYNWIRFWGNGSVKGSSKSDTTDRIILGDIDNNFSTAATIHFFQYTDTTRNKTVLARHNCATAALHFSAGVFRNTNAITEIKVFPGANSYVAGSVFTLYGIKAA